MVVFCFPFHLEYAWSWWINKRFQRKTKQYELWQQFCTAIQIKVSPANQIDVNKKTKQQNIFYKIYSSAFKRQSPYYNHWWLLFLWKKIIACLYSSFISGVYIHTYKSKSLPKVLKCKGFIAYFDMCDVLFMITLQRILVKTPS
jgi:hypothetical protein